MLLILFILAIFAPLTLCQQPLLPSPTLTNYFSVYSGRCAESTSTVDTYISSRVQWAAYTEYTNLLHRTWTTIYPSPTPTSFPTTVELTHLSSATNEYWFTLSNGSVTYTSIEMVVVSFVYMKELKTRPTALTMTGLQEGCKRIGH
ncbi:hypothetical protein QBC43DRAFT_339288 [Cladorrhinum sp. PSN259]|nr:hypothetical protein QBC43DRAFT_339288 [Cladorrhinum sp. PSN259]